VTNPEQVILPSGSLPRPIIAIALTFAIVGLSAATPCRAAAGRQVGANRDYLLVKLAAARFPNLTRAERALLNYADVSNAGRGEFAVAGVSAIPLDPSNDPSGAAEWSHDRDIRAALIRWLAVDHGASARIDPTGIRVLGARIVGPIDLSYMRVPFAIALLRCSIPERISMEQAEVPYLDLNGSHTGAIFAPSLVVTGDLDIGWDNHDYGNFEASGQVWLESVRIGGSATFGGGHFHYGDDGAWDSLPERKTALHLSAAEVKHGVTLCCSFESVGAVELDAAVIGGNLACNGGHFTNPDNLAIVLDGATIGGVVLITPFQVNDSVQTADLEAAYRAKFRADGLVSLTGAHVGGSMVIDHATFGGKTTERHGLVATATNISDVLVMHQLNLQHGAILNLAGASARILSDDVQSWPAPGKLWLDGFDYHSIAAESPRDVTSRLRWLGLQTAFYPQPYRQLARVMRESGDDTGADAVLIAMEDARFKNSGFFRRAWAVFLKGTIGYGHRPLLAVFWSLAVVLLGWALVAIGGRSGVMRPTWPESIPASAEASYEELHPLLYSLDVFLPFVNLHQEHYWWPDARASGYFPIFGHRLRMSGRALRYYLWLQVIAGWLLSAIFVAGVTGLLRNDY
jgi:hypothetical protein